MNLNVKYVQIIMIIKNYHDAYFRKKNVNHRNFGRKYKAICILKSISIASKHFYQIFDLVLFNAIYLKYLNLTFLHIYI